MFTSRTMIGWISVTLASELHQAIEKLGELPHLKRMLQFIADLDNAIEGTNGAGYIVTLEGRYFKVAILWPANPQISLLAQEEYLHGVMQHDPKDPTKSRYLFHFRTGKGGMESLVLDKDLNIDLT